jgi:hypothetical protein
MLACDGMRSIQRRGGAGWRYVSGGERSYHLLRRDSAYGAGRVATIRVEVSSSTRPRHDLDTRRPFIWLLGVLVRGQCRRFSAGYAS